MCIAVPGREAINRELGHRNWSLNSVSTLNLMSRYWAADLSDNTQHRVGRAERELSSLIYLRKFNNWVKAVQISKAAQCWPRGGKAKVLDISCGKGGDMAKWRSVKTYQYVGIGKYEANLARIRATRKISLARPSETLRHVISRWVKRPSKQHFTCWTAIQ